jgi:hypothetical protein
VEWKLWKDFAAVIAAVDAAISHGESGRPGDAESLPLQFREVSAEKRDGKLKKAVFLVLTLGNSIGLSVVIPAA